MTASRSSRRSSRARVARQGARAASTRSRCWRSRAGWSPAARRQRGRRLGLDVAAHRSASSPPPRPASSPGWCELRAREPLVDVRHDADPGGLVDEHLGDALRLRDVLDDDRRCRVPADAARAGLRLRRVGHRVGFRAAAALRPRCSSPASSTGAFATRYGSKVPLVVGFALQRARHAVPGRRARQRVELLRGHGARRTRHRLRVLGDVEPDRRGRAARSRPASRPA